jgi:hypothetical protein
VVKTGAFMPEQTVRQLNKESKLQISGMLWMKVEENPTGVISTTALEF